jgi:hypothetical protein
VSHNAHLTSVQELLTLCCRFFCELSKNSEATKMTPDNIGISIGPTLMLSPKIRNDPNAFIGASNKAPAILAYCVANFDALFES